jgi:hypothetical protein
MRLFMLAWACAVLVSGPASACRGLWEYPETMQRLAMTELPGDAKRAFQKRLEAGWALHQKAEKDVNPDLMRESVDILDQIKSELPK